jgi:glycosyltransferase involved in cell wall biosynthesis
MKVLHVELGRHLYGGARQVCYLLNGLKDFPSQHALVCCQGAELLKAIANPALTLYCLAMKGDHDLGYIGRLRRIIHKEKPDLVHIHSRKGDFLSAVAARLEGCPAVLSRRIDNPPRPLELKVKFPLFQKIITISRGIAQVLIKAGVDPEKIVCVPSAIDTERYRPVCDRGWFRQEFDLSDDTPVAAIVAQLIDRKGHRVLFDALPRVLEKYSTLVVLVLGQGPLEQALKAYTSKLAIGHALRFLGFRPDLDRLLPCIDVLVHPAWMEGLGVSLLEAAASGIPIVATRTGGIPEIVHDRINGFLFACGDHRHLAQILIELLSDRQNARAAGAEGRRIVLERFSIANMVKGNHGVYESLLA